mmetsp:Transcript_5354/g.10088  ORF Transcript_5354/g.10088 Transcript_5354/m.10088 type:complete len:99 (-) Transcript_5354:1402-1698(-)
MLHTSVDKAQGLIILTTRGREASRQAKGAGRQRRQQQQQQQQQLCLVLGIFRFTSFKTLLFVISTLTASRSAHSTHELLKACIAISDTRIAAIPTCCN